MVGLVELAGVWYGVATPIGAVTGAVTNFLLGRLWSFQATHMTWGPQAKRYALIAVGSLLVNSGGVILVTEKIGLQYAVSKLVVSFLVVVFFNFPLHRYYVFR